MLSIYCLPWGLSLSVICISSKIPLKKTNFYFANNFQLEISSWLVMGICVHFCLYVLGPCVTCACVEPTLVVTISVRSLLCLVLLCLYAIVSCVFHPLWLLLLPSSASSLDSFLNPEGMHFTGMFFRTESSIVFYALHIVHL